MRTIKFLLAALALIAFGVACTAATEATAPEKVTQVASASAPQVCLDALDKAEKVMEHSKTGFDYTAEMAGAASDGFMAAASFDVGGINDASDAITAVNRKMEKLTPKMTSAVEAYTDAAAKCRAL